MKLLVFLKTFVVTIEDVTTGEAAMFEGLGVVDVAEVVVVDSTGMVVLTAEKADHILEKVAHTIVMVVLLIEKAVVIEIEMEVIMLVSLFIKKNLDN